MTAKTFTETEKEAARAAGFKTKKPKKPKSKTEKSLNSYITRYNAWVDKLKAKAKLGKVKVEKKKKLQSLKDKVSSL